jgi:DNA polymerase III sliding clamp (beta) subunit (PCNA family)
VQGDIFINTRPINETYPNYRGVIPEYTSPGTFDLDRAGTLKTLADLAPVVNKETGALALSFMHKNVQIRVENLDTGSEAIRNLDSNTTNLAGSGYRIGFNDKLLKTVASNVDSQALSFQVNPDNPNRAAVINNEFLLMPVMLPTLAETVEAYG